MRPDKYILNEAGEPVPERNLMKWANWMEQPGARMVAMDKIGEYIEVSTVFLGLDHNFTEDGPPILFETMIFGPKEHYNSILQRNVKQETGCWRYATKTEALEGHQRAVEQVFLGDNHAIES